MNIKGLSIVNMLFYSLKQLFRAAGRAARRLIEETKRDFTIHT